MSKTPFPGMSTRAANKLARAGFKNRRQLIEALEGYDMLSGPDIGAKTIEELREWLKNWPTEHQRFASRWLQGR